MTLSELDAVVPLPRRGCGHPGLRGRASGADEGLRAHRRRCSRPARSSWASRAPRLCSFVPRTGSPTPDMNVVGNDSRRWPSRSTRLSGCGTPAETDPVRGRRTAHRARRAFRPEEPPTGHRRTRSCSSVGFGCDAESNRPAEGGHRRPDWPRVIADRELAAVAFYAVSSWTSVPGRHTRGASGGGRDRGMPHGPRLEPRIHGGASSCGRSRISLRGRLRLGSFPICRGRGCTSSPTSSSNAFASYRPARRQRLTRG